MVSDSIALTTWTMVSMIRYFHLDSPSMLEAHMQPSDIILDLTHFGDRDLTGVLLGDMHTIHTDQVGDIILTDQIAGAITHILHITEALDMVEVDLDTEQVEVMLLQDVLQVYIADNQTL